MKISKTGGGVVVPSAQQPPPSSPRPFSQSASSIPILPCCMAAYAASSEHSKADFFFVSEIESKYALFIGNVTACDRKINGLYNK